ncbi:MAG: peroxiredoxin [Nanohaloarchaea archaeon]|nr:peroxiredoxin [Candidatus Nanohaloarchaea archaeon]
MKFSELVEKTIFKIIPSKGKSQEQGDKVPVFELENQEGKKVSSDQIENALIYFYPKAGTSGCTEQACDLRDNIKRLEELDLNVYGISVNSVDEQKEFHENQELNFDLLADENGEVAEKFGVLTEAGVSERTSFLVRDGKIERIFRKVSPSEHVQKVLKSIEN